MGDTNMRRLTVGAAVASLALAGTAGPAALAKPAANSNSGKRAHVYRAQLEAVAVAGAAVAPTPRGKAQLIDGVRNDKLAIHLRGLQPGTYEWHIHKAPAGVTDPCAAPGSSAAPLADWIFRSLIADAHGNANSQGRSYTFTADPAATYYVDVHRPDETVVACGVLRKPVRKDKRGQSDPTPVQPADAGTGAAGTAGADTPFVVDTPGGLPAAGQGGVPPTPVAGDEEDQDEGHGERPSGKRGHGHGKPGHPRGREAKGPNRA
jgi:hypothetical protein